MANSYETVELNSGSGGSLVAGDEFSQDDATKFMPSSTISVSDGAGSFNRVGDSGVSLPVAGNTVKDGSGTVLPFLLDADGHLQVDVLSAATTAITAASLPLPTGAATAALQGTANTALTAIQAAVEGTLTVGSHEVTNAGTFAVQVDGDALTTLQAIAGYLDTEIASILTAVQLIDNIVAGNEAQVDVVGALPAGDNNIGNVDVVSLPGELSGPGSPTIDSYTAAAISASANTADQQVIAAPGANKQIWVYGYQGTADTGDGSIAFQDEDDTALTGVMAVAENGGFAVVASGNFAMPLFKVATNKALEIDTSVCGFKGTIQYAIVSV